MEVEGQRMTQNYQFQSVILHVSGTVDHIKVFFTKLENTISPGVFLFFFKKNTTLQILKFLSFLCVHFNSFLVVFQVDQ